MKHVSESAGHPGEVIEEVELSAADLLDLVPTPTEPVAKVKTSDTDALSSSDVAAGETTAFAPAIASASSAPATTSRNNGSRFNPMYASAAAIVMAIAAMVAIQSRADQDRQMHHAVSNWPPPPEPAPIAEETPIASEPTRYANPFDPQEVFELPPGITGEQARTMVADILLKRAAERQARR
jgi:hypothetical protein